MSKIKIEIKNRFTGKVIFAYEKENNTISETVKEYIRQEIQERGKFRANLTDANLTDADLTRANLTDANLTDADLTDANLTDANLTRADLTRADLTDADLTRANLTRADLTRADLTDADLTRANLTRADLTRADLTDADLTRANLTRANLTRADLTRANLLHFKSDLWRILLMAKKEIPGLILALKEGRIDGTVYEGDCACLKGTIANVSGQSISSIPWMVKNSSEPAERWFLQIQKGQTPENSAAVRKTLEWIEEFQMYLNA